MQTIPSQLGFASLQSRSGRQTLATLTLLLITVSAQAACPSEPTISRFSFNSSGSEVHDLQTGLTWQRCSAGQAWDNANNICTGTASTMNHQAALSYAKDQTDWRLPSIRELHSLADIGCLSPAIDTQAFPNMPPSQVYWSATPAAANAASAWSVYFLNGSANNGSRNNSYAVRLVRVNQ